MKTAKRIRVLCVDDHPLMREGISSIVANESDMDLVGEAGNGREAIDGFRRLHPDVVLMDLRMPDMDGIEATRIIRQQSPDAKIIALTSYNRDQDICRALEAGVRGYLLKEAVHREVLNAIRTVYRGESLIPRAIADRVSEYALQEPLTPREREVLSFVARGLANKEIAWKLGITEGTVRTHMENIFQKLAASDRTHAVTIAMERGILNAL